MAKSSAKKYRPSNGAVKKSRSDGGNAYSARSSKKKVRTSQSTTSSSKVRKERSKNWSKLSTTVKRGGSVKSVNSRRPGKKKPKTKLQSLGPLVTITVAVNVLILTTALTLFAFKIICDLDPADNFTTWQVTVTSMAIQMTTTSALTTDLQTTSVEETTTPATTTIPTTTIPTTTVPTTMVPTTTVPTTTIPTTTVPPTTTVLTTTVPTTLVPTTTVPTTTVPTTTVPTTTVPTTTVPTTTVPTTTVPTTTIPTTTVPTTTVPTTTVPTTTIPTTTVPTTTVPTTTVPTTIITETLSTAWTTRVTTNPTTTVPTTTVPTTTVPTTTVPTTTQHLTTTVYVTTETETPSTPTIFGAKLPPELVTVVASSDIDREYIEPDNSDEYDPFTYSCGVPNVEPNLVGTENGAVAVEHSWPYTLHLLVLNFSAPSSSRSFEQYSHVCSATLLTPKHGISAALCFVDRGPATYYFALAGYPQLSDYVDADTFLRMVSRVRLHPKTNLYTGYPGVMYDFAVLTFNNHYDLTRTGAELACLPTPNLSLPPGTVCWVSGWGSADPGSKGFSDQLRQFTVDIVSEFICQRDFYVGVQYESTFCGGTDRSKDTCIGDLGAPVYCYLDSKWTLYGISSFGRREICGIDYLTPYGAVSFQLEWMCCFLGDIPPCDGITCVPEGAK